MAEGVAVLVLCLSAGIGLAVLGRVPRGRMSRRRFVCLCGLVGGIVSPLPGTAMILLAWRLDAPDFQDRAAKTALLLVVAGALAALGAAMGVLTGQERSKGAAEKEKQSDPAEEVPRASGPADER